MYHKNFVKLHNFFEACFLPMGTGSSLAMSSSSNHIQKSSTVFWPMDVAYNFFKLKKIKNIDIRKNNKT